ncbi:hypothetical protein A8C32_18495 [Flavivirga aquatica]|uniref:Uncharacterized protein n=1 Tax=Flavivirga aquatica TaxID=1849968 RepID=A0A1E5T7S3_9FLAO|nr:hypothetical protein [Flavivirga aquatica]OEK07423.1 hypothetical protein A8C32_18495 [Flavivirga aquatica]
MDIPEFLYHYYEIEQGPFKNITQNKFEKAQDIQNRISTGFNSKRPSNYIDLRFSLEKRLKKGFIDKGGKPKRDDPFYFTLGKCNWMKSCFENPGTIKIPLSNFNSKQISFTYPDSMVSFQIYDEPKLSLYKKASNGQIYLLNEISDLLDKYGLPSEEKWQSQENMKYDRYIEAQVWDDFLIDKYQQKP